MTAPSTSLAAIPPPPIAWAPGPSQRRPNALGIWALVVALLGVVLSLLSFMQFLGLLQGINFLTAPTRINFLIAPIALIVFLISFVLGIVAVCLRGKRKGPAVTAIIVSVVVPLISFILFIAMLFVAFSGEAR
jgi:hypothetical protein